ncbi:hypothetical protein [Aliiroseovarius sp. 2305UL8-7]|uniref:hypothetical protein n=1 Tax=Aliiroseovarius conchicola TaxID=3121637 RepID=UPI003527B763
MRVLVLFLSLVIPQTALALSCMPYNAIAAFKDAATADEDYVVVVGELSFDKRKLPKVDWSDQMAVQPDNILPGKIRGKSLTRKGFTNDFTRDITINVQCAGPWCASLTEGRYLTYLKRVNGTYTLAVNPCGGFAFADPDKDTLKRVTACMQGKRCNADLPER